jgi:PAS domain S-box-containing protein
LIDDTIETEFHDQAHPQGLAFVSCGDTFSLFANLGTAGSDIGAITVVDFRPKCSNRRVAHSTERKPALLMRRNQTAIFRGPVAQLFYGIIALTLMSFVCFQLKADNATVAFIYLVVIVLLSLMGSYFASAVLILLAVAALNYFFTRPIFSFNINLPEDVALVIVFPLVSFIVTGLVRRAHQEQRELRLAINTLPALVWSALPDGSLDFINQRWKEIGLSLADLRGSEWVKVLHPDERPRVADRWRTAVESGTPYENVEHVRTADGKHRRFLSRAQPLRDELGKIIKWYGADIDIEDQKRAEEALRESEQRFRDYAESGSDWYWETGWDHRFITIAGKPTTVSRIPSDPIGLTRWDFALDLEEEPEKWRCYKADLDAHRPFRDFRYRVKRTDGSEGYVSVSGKPVFDPQEGFIGYRGVASDLTDAMRAAQLEEALQEAKVVGDNIAHDLRTPLSRLRIRLERGRERATTLEEFRAVADQAIADLDHSMTTITALLRITEIEQSRRREGFGEIPLAPLIREVGDLYDPIADNKSVTFRVEASDEATVRGDRDLLFEAIANLVDNAVKFTPEGGGVEVGLLRREGEAVIRVRDSGPGISERERDVVTRRFYRSDKTRNTKGMGLGLSMVAAIIKMHEFKLEISTGPCCTMEIVCPHLN